MDAQNLSEGEHQLPITASTKNPNIDVVAVEPNQLTLKLEANTSKEIKLETAVTGVPDRDYEMKDLKVSVDKVKVSGASSVLAGLKSLPIKVNLDGTETADFSRKVTLEAPAEWNLNGKTVSFDPGVIQMEIEIRKKKTVENVVENNSSDNTGNTSTVDETELKRKSLMVEVVKQGELQNAVKELLPTNVLVTVEGEAGAVDSLTNASLKLNLSPERVVGGNYIVNTEDIVIPEGLDIKIVEFSPEKVSVKF
ncbi:hypothetical protein IT411_02425 [Candidatus Peregrinibacteria bacterium]|nr:hypothetical protein [Candidatus Peregrinibacteria bacterium]